MNEDIILAVKGRLSAAEDNHYRATCAAKGRDVHQQWGQSGETLQQIIDGYQAEIDRWKRALDDASKT